MAKTTGAKLRQPANKMLDAENKVDGVTAKFLTGDGRTVTIYGGIVTEVSEKETRARVMRGKAATKGNRRQ